jgi:hypothetical protein
LTDQETSNIPDSPTAKPQPKWIARCIQRGKNYLRERGTKKQQETAQDRASRRTADATIWIAILTAVTVGVGISQYVIFGRQLDVMENDKRPWLSAEISIPAYVVVTEWEKSRGIDVPLRFSLKNYGQQPAINVRVYPRVALHPGNPRREELSIIQKGICDSAGAESDKNPIGGIAVFPTETEVVETGSSISGDAIYKNGEATLFALLGCVDYTYGNGKHGQTGFRFMIGQDVGGLVWGVPFVEGKPVEGYDIPDDVIKKGFPASPPKEARIPISDIYFKPADSGNYAK